MMPRRFLDLILVVALLAANISAPLVATAQTAKPITRSLASLSDADLASRLAVIEKGLEEKRKEYHIPGMSFVIVKDDKIIFLKGFGLKDVAHNLPVTPDTLFAIGSSTKAFTAMTAVMSADDGKLSLDDSPKKYLPYFRLRDPEADAKITVRDLMTHSSGLDRTDLAMVTGKLNREEMIKVAGLAKPSAKFREKFMYQNVMFAAAGEVVARAQNSTWEDVVRKRILVPLGMKATNLYASETLKARDYSIGYDYNAAINETRALPMRDITPAGPAGSINSTAREMAEWLRLMLGGGVYNGKRLVSEKGFNELVKAQMKIGGNVSYGLGWFLREWKGHKLIEHGGNIDGFNAQVAFMPDQKLGLVMLTNISSSPLGAEAMEMVWSNLVGNPNETSIAVSASEMEREAGNYLLSEAGITFNVELKEGKLVLTVPGQPAYTLESVGSQRYRLAGAPDGFFVTFRPVKGKETETEIYLEQPQGNFVLSRVKGDATKDAAAANDTGPLTDLIGSYESEKGGPVIEITVRDGKVMMIVPGQQPYTLKEREKGVLSLLPLPDDYSVAVRRDSAGKVEGITISQPEGVFPFNRVKEFTASISVEELMAKSVAALGGEANWRKHRTMKTTFDMDFEHQGITSTGQTLSSAPNKTITSMALWTLGKQIGTSEEYFDGTRAAQETSFTPTDVKTGKALEDARIASDFYGPLDWKTLFKTVVIRKMSKLGDEEVYVVVKTPEKGNVVTDYISAKTFLLLRRDTTLSSSTSELELPVTETYNDYREVDGVKIPFRVETKIPTIGNIVTKVKEVKFDVDIPDSAFKPQKRG